MNPLVLAAYIVFAISELVRNEIATFPEILVDYTNDNDDEDILGTLHITDFTISGLETITNLMNNVNGTEDENENNNACMYLPIGYLQFTANYVADIGIANEIPIYGDGKILFTMNDIDLTVCAFFNYTENAMPPIDDVTSHLSYHHSPVEFTGFLKNKQVSAISERLLNIANIFLAMWSAYEPSKAGCLFNPFLQYIMNGYKEYEDNTISYDTILPCLEGSILDEIADYGGLKDYLLTMMETDKSDSSLREFLDNEDTRSIISEFIYPVIQKIKD